MISAAVGEAAPRILYVVDSARGHITQQVRGFQYRNFFEDAGWKIRFLDAAVDSEEAIAAAARDYDLISLLKSGTPALLRRIRAGTSAPIVFDLTDALWTPFHRRRGWHDLERLLRGVDAVLAENETLCAYARRFNGNVSGLPATSSVERFDAFRRLAPARDPGKIIVGWVGSRTTVGALQKVRAVLARLSGRHPHLEVRVVGGDPSEVARILQGIPHTVLAEYGEADMIREMLALDIGIFPAPLDAEDYRLRGPLKALLYMAAGLPVVCQSGGECSRILRDGVTGMLADSEEAWEAKLEALILSPALRREMGNAALDLVRARHSLEASFAALQKALLEIRAGQGRTRRAARENFRTSSGDWIRSRVFRADALLAGLGRRLA